MNIKRYIPEEWRVLIRGYRAHWRESKLFRELVNEHAGGRSRRVPEGPVAPEEIVATTALMRASDAKLKGRKSVFLGSGYRAMGAFLGEAIAAGFRLDQADAAFELGCGGGRLIRHMRIIEGLRLVGSDLQPYAIEWCRENIPGVELHKNELQPPLSFAASGSFDFAFAYSVFTHIPIELQLPWVQELARILKPGGIATVTTLGSEMARIMMNEDEFAQFESEGTYTMDPDHPRVSESSAVLGSWDVFMTEQHLRKVFDSAMEVVRYVDAPQALVVLRNR
jgi:SAM-dependent methyltransferase